MRFFEQFIESPGFPRLAGEWDYDEETRVVTLTVWQGPPEEGGDEGAYASTDEEGDETPRFDLAFAVDVFGKDGARLATLHPALASTGGRKVRPSVPIYFKICVV